MRVCKTFCDLCDKEFGSEPKQIAMGRLGNFFGKEKLETWFKFDLCDGCFESARPTFRKIWQKRLGLDFLSKSAKETK